MISDIAELYNAERLKDYCSWYMRRHGTAVVESSQDQDHE